MGARGAPKGNNNAARGIRFRQALENALNEYEDMPNGIAKGTALRAICTMIVADCLSPDPHVRIPTRNELANRLDGKAKETIDAKFTHAVAEEMTDEQLLDIARESGDGATATPPSPEDPSAVH
jgi:hypothetical protein